MNKEQIFNEFAKYVESNENYYNNSKHGIIEDVLAWLNIPSNSFVGANSYVHTQNLNKLHDYLMDSATEEQLRQVYELSKGLDLPKYSPLAESAGKVFVSMPMNKKKCECVDDIRRGTEAAIIDSGYQPYYLDKDVHNENIVNKMLEEIVACRFLVADLTSQNTGVYFEAGYAKAMGKTVIFTCHKKDFDNIHFDLKQTQIVRWDDADDLQNKLTEHIKRTNVSCSYDGYQVDESIDEIEKKDEIQEGILKDLLNQVKGINDFLLSMNRSAHSNPDTIMPNLELLKEKVFDVVSFQDTNSFDLKSVENDYHTWTKEWDLFAHTLKTRVNKALSVNDKLILGKRMQAFKDSTSAFIAAIRQLIS